jgi:hypothetical protein
VEKILAFPPSYAFTVESRFPMPKQKGRKSSHDSDHFPLHPLALWPSLRSPTIITPELQHNSNANKSPTGQTTHMGHGVQPSKANTKKMEDTVGLPLTKDLLRRKNRIDQFVEEVFRSHIEQANKGPSTSNIPFQKRHSLDFGNLEFENMKYTRSSISSSPVQVHSSLNSPMFSSDKSSVFRSDQNVIVRNVSKSSIYTATSQPVSETSEDDQIVDDTDAVNHIWLHQPRWSTTTGFKAMIYRVASRCVRSRQCEKVSFMLDLSTDDIIEAAVNIGTVQNIRNELILDKALHHLEDDWPTINKMQHDPYSHSELSTNTSFSDWNNSGTEERGPDHVYRAPNYQRSNPSSHNLHITPMSSVSSLALSSTKPADKRSSRTSGSPSQGRKSHEIFEQDDRLSSVELPNCATSNPSRPSKLTKLGISDKTKQEPFVKEMNIRFEHTSLHFLSRTNKLRLLLWTILGKW